ITFALEDDPERFLELYNQFAATKGLPTMSLGRLRSYMPGVRVTSALLNGEPLAFHAHLVDEQSGRAMLFRSVSRQWRTEWADRQLIGRAKRFLHFQDAVYFRGIGVGSYDFGGYAVDTNDADLAGINNFKLSFGGQIVEQSHYVSLALHWLTRLR